MPGGFLGYPTSFMLDVVVCALVLVMPTLAYSLWLVRVRKNYALHRKFQIGLGLALLITVTLFEIDMRLAGGWKALLAQRAVPLSDEALSVVRTVLYVHIAFAVSTLVLWSSTFALMWGKADVMPRGRSRTVHRSLGWSSVGALALTAVTGVAWYGLAFIA